MRTQLTSSGWKFERYSAKKRGLCGPSPRRRVRMTMGMKSWNTRRHSQLAMQLTEKVMAQSSLKKARGNGRIDGTLPQKSPPRSTLR